MDYLIGYSGSLFQGKVNYRVCLELAPWRNSENYGPWVRGLMKPPIPGGKGNFDPVFLKTR